MRLPFSQLAALLDALTDRYDAGLIDIVAYVDDWDDVIGFAGWTSDEVGDEIERQWDGKALRMSLSVPKC